MRRLGLQPSALPGWATSAPVLGVTTSKNEIMCFKVFWTRFHPGLIRQANWLGKRHGLAKKDRALLITAFRRLIMPCDLLWCILLKPLPEKTGTSRNGRVHGVVRILLLWIYAMQSTFLLMLGFFEGKVLWRRNQYSDSKQSNGPVVQLGRTSPSRGEDHRFKSGPAHFVLLRFCVVRVAEKVY